MDRQKDRQKGEWRMDGMMEGCTDEQMMDGQKDESCVDGWRGWMMDGQTDADSFLRSRLFCCHENRCCCSDGAERSGAEHPTFSSAIPPLPKSPNPAVSPHTPQAQHCRGVSSDCIEVIPHVEVLAKEMRRAVPPPRTACRSSMRSRWMRSPAAASRGSLRMWTWDPRRPTRTMKSPTATAPTAATASTPPAPVASSPLPS